MSELAIECLDCGITMTRIPGLYMCTACGSNNVELVTFDPLDPDGEEDDEAWDDDDIDEGDLLDMCDDDDEWDDT